MPLRTVTLSDYGGARTLVREIDDILTRRPRLGTLVGEAQALRTQITRTRGTGVPGASALTVAELRPDGTISGIPTTVGSYMAVVEARNSGGQATQPAMIIVAV